MVEAAGKLGREKGEHSQCVQLFLCRMSPVIWNVQDTVKARPMDYSRSISSNLDSWTEAIFDPSMSSVPDMNSIVDFGRKSCDERFPGCKLVDFRGLIGKD